MKSNRQLLHEYNDMYMNDIKCINEFAHKTKSHVKLVNNVEHMEEVLAYTTRTDLVFVFGVEKYDDSYLTACRK